MSQFFSYLHIAAADFLKYVWPSAGPLVGVLIGGYIASRSQHRHWVLDSKRLEFKELFATLTRAYSAMMRAYGPGVHTGEDERLADELRIEALNTIRDRVAIAPEARTMRLGGKWENAVFAFARNRDYKGFATSFETIMDELHSKADDLIK